MPSSSSVHVNAPLSAFASGYTPGDFIADHVVPVIEVDKPKGTYFSKSKEDVVTLEDDLASDSSEPPVYDYATAKNDFTLEARHGMAYVPYALIDAADDPLKPREEYARTVMQKLLLAHERRVAVKVMTVANYATANQITAAALWSNPATSTPVADVNSARVKLAPADPGKTKLVGVCSLEVALSLGKHPDILGLRGGGSLMDGQATWQEIARKLMLDELLVSDAEYATSARGAAALVTGRVWDKTKFAVIRVPRTPPSMENSQSIFACSFRWKGPNNAPFQAIEWEEPKRGPGNGSVGIKVSHWTLAASVIQNDMGAIISTVGA